MNKRRDQKLHLHMCPVCSICRAYGMGDGIYHFSTSDLLREERETDLVIRSNIVSQHVISTLYPNITMLWNQIRSASTLHHAGRSPT